MSEHRLNTDFSETKLNTLTPGMCAVISKVGDTEPALRRHLLDMGLTPGTEVHLVKVAPMGDPLEFHLRGYELTLRKEDAEKICTECTFLRNLCRCRTPKQK